MKNYSSSQKEVSRLCNEVIHGINQLSNPMEKYCAYREVYFIHPSFHERWFFDDHIHYLANNLYTGKHGFGLKSFLSENNLPQVRIDSMATFCIKRTILLENILSGYLDSTLSDYGPIPNVKFPKYKEAIKPIIEPNYSPEKIVSHMPEIFQLVQTLLEKTAYRVLEGGKLLSFGGWGNYAQCAINEGPIFHKKSSESRVNIFKKISTTSPIELQNELEKYFKIQIVRPFDEGGEGASLSQQYHYVKPVLKERKPSSISPINSERKKTSTISETYRPEFTAVIASYKQIAGSNFRNGGTSSKENYIVKIKKTPPGVMYYFCHFPRDKKFSIELNVNTTRAPQYTSTIEKLNQKRFTRLPNPIFKEQKTKGGTWLRLQFFYPDDTPPLTVVQGMFDLMDQSYPEILLDEN